MDKRVEVRKPDRSARITIPKTMREELGIVVGDSIEIFIDYEKKEIILRKMN